MSITEKYQSGKITREAAAQLFADMGVDPEKAEFFLAEADKGKAEQDKNAAQKPTGAPQSPRKRKQEETPADDEKDAQEAEEAKKSLGRPNGKRRSEKA